MNGSSKDNSINKTYRSATEGSGAMNADDSDSDHGHGSNKFLSVKGDTTPSLTTPRPTLCLQTNSSVFNEQDGRVAEGSALNADDDNNIEECNRSERDHSPPDELVVVTNRGGFYISQGLSCSLPSDTFSFIFISSLFSFPFLIAILVVSFQITTYSVLSA